MTYARAEQAPIKVWQETGMIEGRCRSPYLWHAFCPASSFKASMVNVVAKRRESGGYKEREMPLTGTLEAYLDEQGLKYVTLRHSAAYTAQELAAMLHIAGQQLAKTVIVKVDGEPAMVVLPASQRIDFQRLSKALGGKPVALAAERELAGLFPNCELGAMPPFGNLFGL